jgi:hypothetical protein
MARSSAASWLESLAGERHGQCQFHLERLHLLAWASKKEYLYILRLPAGVMLLFDNPVVVNIFGLSTGTLL